MASDAGRATADWKHQLLYGHPERRQLRLVARDVESVLTFPSVRSGRAIPCADWPNLASFLRALVARA